MMLNKKKIQVIFLLFKTVHEVAETTRKIDNAFGPELLTNIQCSGDLSFAKETIALKMRSAVAGHQKVTVMN